MSALGVYTQRWYGNDPFDTGGGPRVEVAYHGFERWRLEGDAEYLRLGFHTETFENGNYLDANFYPNFYLPPTAFLRPIFGFIRQFTSDPAYANTGYRLGLGYHQELPHGITVELQGEVFLSYYDGVNATLRHHHGATRPCGCNRVSIGATGSCSASIPSLPSFSRATPRTRRSSPIAAISSGSASPRNSDQSQPQQPASTTSTLAPSLAARGDEAAGHGGRRRLPAAAVDHDLAVDEHMGNAGQVAMRDRRR